MGTCGCGYSTDANKNYNGTHRVVQAVKADLAKELAANNRSASRSLRTICSGVCLVRFISILPTPFLRSY